MKAPPRFFLAHSKSADDAELDRLVTACSSLLDRFAKGGPFDLVLGRAYFEARFKELGSWAAWTAEVATGVDYVTRAPIFTAIFVPAAPIGAGTRAIVSAALGIQKPVFAFDDGGKSARVVAVKVKDAKDWQTGTRLVCAGPLR